MAAFTTTLALMGLGAIGVLGSKAMKGKDDNAGRTRSGNLGPRGNAPAPAGAEIVGKAVPRGTSNTLGTDGDTPPSTTANASVASAAAGVAGERARKRAQAGNMLLMKNSSGGAANPRAMLNQKTLVGASS